MKLKTLLVAIAAVLGIGGSAAAYQLAASPASPVKPAAHHSVAKAAAKAPKVAVPKILPVTKFEWAPCEPPAELKGDECVTQVVQTVTLPSTSSGGGQQSSGGHAGEHSGGGGDDADEPASGGGDDDGQEPEDGEDDHGNGGEDD